MVHLRMARSDWEDVGVVVEGFEACRAMFGL